MPKYGGLTVDLAGGGGGESGGERSGRHFIF